ncbi:hypothetical protein MIND_00924200 [Mycena indigotica]|uniref:Uncharacterized protein n=1 Tax=Mycena indigotica TaxID=2126181 RepID=A0A8H6VWS7_9AGAR|nr:uncharacterized protein MIND_00924200 [Mycena indigotica]KAF7296924.1 hypothetical protein MIND_00924200 [Mycena indigotica]
MSTTTTLTIPLPPSQRLRFIRSMKKLGDLLTETQSTLALPDPLHNGPRHGRSASVSLSPGSSSSRTFFSLRTPTLRSPGPLSATFPPNAYSPASATPITPTTIDPEALKEHNLAKASSMLGENVPPELVMHKGSKGKGRKRSSTVSVPEFSTPSQTQTLPRKPRHSPRPSLKHAVSSSSLAPSSSSDEPFSYDTLVAAADLDIPPVPVLFAPTQSSGSMTAGKRDRSMYRKEACWSGEWSGSVNGHIRTMEDVVRGLRELRA